MRIKKLINNLIENVHFKILFKNLRGWKKKYFYLEIETKNSQFKYYINLHLSFDIEYSNAYLKI